jgi:nucleotidyltransferase substrate binding protein (TIGR01987 family)
MEEDKLDITSLINSVQALEKSVAAFNANALSEGSDTIIDTLRSGVVHDFETAYELSWKYMKRWLEANIPENVKGVNRREFFRIAAENGLISEVRKWWGFHDARNRTAHTYNEAAAVDVFNAAIGFAAEARNFITALERKI